MGLTHIRTPKNFVLEERLERYADAIETHPDTYRGRWAEACWPLHTARADGTGRFAAVKLDLGCGKGAFLAESARRVPEELFIGMDIEPICIAYAAQRIVEEGLGNALVLPRGTGSLERVFAPGELAAIALNFPTPYPKRHFARRRTTTVDNLLVYRELLAPGGTLTLRTDSQPLRDYTLIQLEAAGYRIAWSSNDVRAEHPGFPQTEYEERLAAKGARVFGVQAVPGPRPDAPQIQRGRDAEQSLMAYLPDNLEALNYVPLGMEAAVMNLVNRRRNERERAQRHANGRDTA